MIRIRHRPAAGLAVSDDYLGDQATLARDGIEVGRFGSRVDGDAQFLPSVGCVPGEVKRHQWKVARHFLSVFDGDIDGSHCRRNGGNQRRPVHALSVAFMPVPFVGLVARTAIVRRLRSGTHPLRPELAAKEAA